MSRCGHETSLLPRPTLTQVWARDLPLRPSTLTLVSIHLTPAPLSPLRPTLPHPTPPYPTEPHPAPLYPHSMPILPHPYPILTPFPLYTHSAPSYAHPTPMLRHPAVAHANPLCVQAAARDRRRVEGRHPKTSTGDEQAKFIKLLYTNFSPPISHMPSVRILSRSPFFVPPPPPPCITPHFDYFSPMYASIEWFPQCISHSGRWRRRTHCRALGTRSSRR